MARPNFLPVQNDPLDLAHLLQLGDQPASMYRAMPGLDTCLPQRSLRGETQVPGLGNLSHLCTGVRKQPFFLCMCREESKAVELLSSVGRRAQSLAQVCP